MNKNILIGILVVVVLLVGAGYLMSMKGDKVPNVYDSFTESDEKTPEQINAEENALTETQLNVESSLEEDAAAQAAAELNTQEDTAGASGNSDTSEANNADAQAAAELNALEDADTEVLVGGDAVAGEETPGEVSFTVLGGNFYYDMEEIRVKEGDTVTINFRSVEGFHDWVVDEFNAATGQVSTGGETSVTFVADKKGTFEYYCSVGSHRAQGMVGNLIVE